MAETHIAAPRLQGVAQHRFDPGLRTGNEAGGRGAGRGHFCAHGRDVDDRLRVDQGGAAAGAAKRALLPGAVGRRAHGLLHADLAEQLHGAGVDAAGAGQGRDALLPFDEDERNAEPLQEEAGAQTDQAPAHDQDGGTRGKCRHVTPFLGKIYH